MKWRADRGLFNADKVAGTSFAKANMKSPERSNKKIECE